MNSMMYFRGHTSYTNCGIISRDGLHILTGSSDSTCKLWDYQTAECLFSFRFSIFDE